MIKVNNTDLMSPKEEIMSKIGKMFDIIRFQNISTNDYTLVLFLLSAYKDNFIHIDSVNESHQVKDRLSEYLRNSNNELSNQYSHIYPSFEPLLNKLSENGIRNLLSVLTELNKQVLTENFPDIFDKVLYRISQSQGRFGGEFIQPVELTRFMCGLAKLNKDAKIFNPFAGTASFGVFLDQGQYYYGQEFNKNTWALGVLRLMAYNRFDASRYIYDDSISHWPNQDEKFDLIISNPPFGMRLGHYYTEIESNIRTIEHFLIEKGVQSLKYNGKLIALLPLGFLFRGGEEQRLRERLVEADLIDTIISFPGGLLSNTGIPLIILVLDRTKKYSDRVKFIDAKNFVTKKGTREKVLNDYSLNSFIVSNKEDENVVKFVYNDQIRKNNFNLSVGRYFQKHIDGVKLGDILEFVVGQRRNPAKTGKLIRIRDLKDDKVDFMLDLSVIEESELSRSDLRLVSESCLLVGIRWKTLKPTLFEFKGEPFLRNQDILSFKVDESRVDKSYLINELHADYVKEQLEAIRIGDTIPSIRKEDLLNVVIKLPSIEEQRAKVQGIYELSEKIKNLQDERNALTHGKTTNQFNEFASLKHTLGRPRQNILDWTDNLLDFLDKKKDGFDTLNKTFSEFYDIDIVSALKEIKRDINFITDVLEKGENGLVLSEYEKQIISLSDINNIIRELSNNGFNFRLIKSLLEADELEERGIYANKTLFKTLLDNILTNANKYAFDKKSTGNEVVIDLAEVDDFLSIEIRNNGKPFPKNFNREKFIAKYSTADANNGSGLGGYDIHRIASDFNNPDWILSLNEDPFFLVKFKFQFPIKLIN